MELKCTLTKWKVYHRSSRIDFSQKKKKKMFSKLEYKLIKIIQSERTERIDAKWTEPKRKVGQIKCAIISIIKVSEEKDRRKMQNKYLSK